MRKKYFTYILCSSVFPSLREFKKIRGLMIISRNRDFVIFYVYYNLNLRSYGQILSLFYCDLFQLIDINLIKYYMIKVMMLIDTKTRTKRVYKAYCSITPSADMNKEAAHRGLYLSTTFVRNLCFSFSYRLLNTGQH